MPPKEANKAVSLPLPRLFLPLSPPRNTHTHTHGVAKQMKPSTKDSARRGCSSLARCEGLTGFAVGVLMSVVVAIFVARPGDPVSIPAELPAGQLPPWPVGGLSLLVFFVSCAQTFLAGQHHPVSSLEEQGG